MNRALQKRLLYGSLRPRLLHGEMAERFNAAVLKTAVGQPTVGSNPTLSASFNFFKVNKLTHFHVGNHSESDLRNSLNLSNSRSTTKLLGVKGAERHMSSILRVLLSAT